jgi:ubiquinone/menaquinone biosynthesis C-methylase UbiE
MSERTEVVRAYFDEPQRYLSNDVGIRLRAEVVREFLGDAVVGRMLDMGCGDGTISTQFLQAGLSLTLVDLSSTMLDVARGKLPQDRMGSVAFVVGDLYTYEPGFTFDFVLCIGVLAHIEHVDDAIRRLASLVRPGGLCVIQFTDRRKLVARIEAAVYGVRRAIGAESRYTMNRLGFDEVRTSCESVGFAMKGMRRYSLLLPGMGRLPLGFLYRYERRTLRSRWLSRHGSEVLLLLQRT